MNVFHELRAHVKFERSLNASFIALIPKKARAVDIKYFCIISSASSVYKIISKVLANMFKAVLEKVISRFIMLLSRGVRF